MKSKNEILSELAAYKQSFEDVHWMARRYADGRSSYAPGMYNDALERVMKFGFKPNECDDGYIWARDGDLLKTPS